MYLNIQITSCVEYPTPHEYVGQHRIKNIHLQTALGQPQMLFDPGIVVKLFFKTLKGTIRLVGVFDDEWSLKLILKLPDEFCEKMG